MNLDDDRPICDFCELMIEEDEELTEVRLGEPPEVKPYTIREVRDRSHGQTSLRRREKYDIIMDVISEDPRTDMEVHDEMYVPQHGTRSYKDYERTRDKLGIVITFMPEMPSHDADAEVCPNCADMLSSLND